jgi:hypothetical protein
MLGGSSGAFQINLLMREGYEMKSSTSYENRLVSDFLENPTGYRVELPNGSLAVVREVMGNGDESLCRIQGVRSNGRFCKLPKGVHRWYSPKELKLVYFSVGINPDWSPSL